MRSKSHKLIVAGPPSMISDDFVTFLSASCTGPSGGRTPAPQSATFLDTRRDATRTDSGPNDVCPSHQAGFATNSRVAGYRDRRGAESADALDCSLKLGFLMVIPKAGGLS